MKLIPLLSLILLLITYTILGWRLASTQASQLLYLAIIATIFLLDIMLTVPLPNFKCIITPWFQSDITTFIAVIISAFLFVVIIRWISLSVDALVLMSAGILVRLDTQVYGLKNWQSFVILLIISQGSLGLGIMLYRLQYLA
ncbi:MAG: hypothetical protein F6K48_28740 [Okeania sp. SIO3H1]|uniref:hypothetical protein n=1 Tax=Okeania sp. SIO1I7 TaxID=2607772 RepID=UPI0013C7D0F5|nr:hypothetical protein [Okeania sp. SIO1I7]NEN92672.1 hypothetical protein [Okeania sp. SIO3H1]NET29274.1 hypothetical protein [Okeania sp. SIO1I7]